MTRKILVALALTASTAYVACGGDKAEGGGATTPKPESSMSMSATSAEPMVSSAAPVMSSAPPVDPPKPKTLFELLFGGY